MSHKFGTYISYIFFLGIGFWFYFSSLDLPTGQSGSFGPGYFPKILSILMIVTCIVGIVISFFSKENPRLEIPKLSSILIVIIPTVLFVITWATIGWFYILSLY